MGCRRVRGKRLLARVPEICSTVTGVDVEIFIVEVHTTSGVWTLLVEHLHELGSSSSRCISQCTLVNVNRRAKSHDLHGTSHNRFAVDLTSNGGPIGYWHHVVLHSRLANDLHLTALGSILCTWRVLVTISSRVSWVGAALSCSLFSARNTLFGSCISLHFGIFLLCGLLCQTGG